MLCSWLRQLTYATQRIVHEIMIAIGANDDELLMMLAGTDSPDLDLLDTALGEERRCSSLTTLKTGRRSSGGIAILYSRRDSVSRDVYGETCSNVNNKHSHPVATSAASRTNPACLATLSCAGSTRIKRDGFDLFAWSHSALATLHKTKQEQGAMAACPMRSVAKDEKSPLAQRIVPTALLSAGAGRSERGGSGMHALPRMHVTILGAALCAVWCCALEKGSDRSREQPWPAAACAEERKLSRKSSLADPAVLHPFWRRRFDAPFQDAQSGVVDELRNSL